MDLDWTDRQILATCLLLGIAAAQGDAGVVAVTWRLAERLGVSNDLAALAAERVRQLKEQN